MRDEGAQASDMPPNEGTALPAAGDIPQETSPCQPIGLLEVLAQPIKCRVSRTVQRGVAPPAVGVAGREDTMGQESRSQHALGQPIALLN